MVLLRTLLIPVLGALVFSLNFSVICAQNTEMEVIKNNFSTFALPNSQEITPWITHNTPKYYKHPEFGILPYNSPCSNCVEVLDKRTQDSRYFVDVLNPSKFMIQNALGDLHVLKNGFWVTVNHKLNAIGNQEYRTIEGVQPIGIQILDQRTYIETDFGKVFFNTWQLVGKSGNQETIIHSANWSSYSIGEDGIKITEIFPGIDAEIIAYRGAFKTNFVIKQNQYSSYEKLIFRDQFLNQNSINLGFENSISTENVGKIKAKINGISTLEINEGVGYLKNATSKEHTISFAYKISGSTMDVIVPMDWIESHIETHQLVIDPLVTGTMTLAQTAITGSRYNGTCNFTNSCDYNLTVAAPANATFTNILWSFNYIAAGSCWLEDGATRFRLGSCVSPNVAGFYWFCNQIGTGTCTGANISIFSDLQSCLPAPSCSPQNLVFTMNFFRSCWGSTGNACSNTCIGAGSPWTMTVQGQTVTYSNLSNPIILSNTTICQGQSITASTNGMFGVPGYTYNWSLSPTGLPSVGSGSSVSIPFPTNGSYTIYSTVTDACGNQINASRTVTVTVGATPTFNPVGPICYGSTLNPLPTISTNGITGSWSPSLNNSATTTYTFTPTVGQCASTASLTITVNTQPTQPTLACFQTATFNSTTCSWDVTGSQPAQPSIACFQTATFNTTTCSWDVTGTQPAQPSIACFQTAIFNSTTCSWDISGTQPAQPTLACFQTATFNSTTCSWDVTGSQPAQPSIACFQTATFNPSTCSWDVTGSQPAQPSIACFQTATFNTTTCTWDVTGTQIQPIFNLLSTYCANAYISPLPLTSTNGITGTWSPTLDNTQTTVYSFTPAPGECASPASLTITITPTTIPSFASVDPICAGDVLSPLPTTSQNGVTGSWSPTLNSSQTTLYSFNPNAGQCATSATVTIVVNPLPLVSVTPAFSSICSGSQTNIQLSSQPAGATFGWQAVSTGDATGFSSGTGTSIAQSLSSATTGTVTYAVAGVLNGCPSVAVNAVVNVTQAPVVNASTLSQTLCSNQSIVVNLSSPQAGTAYAWTVNATNVSGASSGSGAVINQQLISAAGGTVVYTVTPTVGTCIGNSIEIEVSVEGVQTPIVSISAGEGCSPVEVTFNNTTPGNCTYAWNFGDGATSSQASPTHIYTQSGCYDATLELVSPSGCISQTLFTDVVCVSESPIAFFTAQNATMNEDNSFNSFVNGSQNATSYSWDFGDGTPPVSSINPSYLFSPVYGNTYNVTLTAMDDEGCSDTYTMTFTIEDNLVYYIPNAFTPDGDQFNQNFKPVFTSGFDPFDYNLKIFNRWGELIFESMNHEIGWDGTYKATEGTCPDGVYVWMIEFKTTSTDARKKIQGHVILMK